MTTPQFDDARLRHGRRLSPDRHHDGFGGAYGPTMRDASDIKGVEIDVVVGKPRRVKKTSSRGSERSGSHRTSGEPVVDHHLESGFASDRSSLSRQKHYGHTSTAQSHQSRSLTQSKRSSTPYPSARRPEKDRKQALHDKPVEDFSSMGAWAPSYTGRQSSVHLDVERGQKRQRSPLSPPPTPRQHRLATPELAPMAHDYAFCACDEGRDPINGFWHITKAEKKMDSQRELHDIPQPLCLILTVV